MKAIIQKRYGGVENLMMVELDKPKYNKNQVLVKIDKANISSGDMKVNTLGVPFLLRIILRLIFGIKGPRQMIRGISASGIIVEVGSKVTRYQIGDKVYFINSMKASCLAEYIALNQDAVMAIKPDNIDFSQAAPLAFGALSAYHFINSKTIKKDMDVLIYGASGSLGTYALQLAKYYGANVAAVSSQKNHQRLKSLGAKSCIDYHKEDFRCLDMTYDLIFDAVMKINKKTCLKVLKENGQFLSVKSPTKESSQRLIEINQIIKEGKLISVIDKTYQFKDFKEAHQHVYSGHKCGNVVINIGG